MGKVSLLVAAVLAIAPATAAATTPPTETEPPVTPSFPANAVAVNDVKVTLADFTIDVPAEVPAGPTRWIAANIGAEQHHMTIIRFTEGQTLSQLFTDFTTDATRALATYEFLPGPQAVAAGGVQAIDVDLQPGAYVSVCVIPGADGVPHAAKGMVKPFTVTGEASATSPAPETPGIELTEYKISVPANLPASGIARIENIGSIAHEAAIYRINDGVTFEQAKAFFVNPAAATGPPPVTPSGGVTAISPGTKAGLVLDLTPGTYAFVCFLPITATNSDHVREGMIAEVTVGEIATIGSGPPGSTEH